MSIRRNCLVASFGVLLMATSPAWSQSLLKSLDPDNDGTVDLAEAKAAASKVFDKLDGDHDGTLDKGELRAEFPGRILVPLIPTRTGRWTKTSTSSSSSSALRKPIQTTTARSMRRS